ncbi:hypothetical protein NPIL_12381, partial [Nephila pilipes]
PCRPITTGNNLHEKTQHISRPSPKLTKRLLFGENFPVAWSALQKPSQPNQKLARKFGDEKKKREKKRKTRLETPSNFGENELNNFGEKKVIEA